MRKNFSTGPWTTAVYRVTPEMVKMMDVESLHHAVCQNVNPENPRGTLIALCGEYDGFDSETAANVRLISLAPQMLEVLTGFVRQMESGIFPNLSYAKAIEILDKVRGGS